MGSNIDVVVVIEQQDVPTYVASLPVPNVREMIRENRLEVPERYIRNQEEMPKRIEITHHETPTIDVSLLSTGQEGELKKQDMPRKEWGFFQVVNHGVAAEVLQNMEAAAAKFLDLPLEDKNKFAIASNDIQGYGHAYVVSEEQKLDWYDMLILITYPSQYQRLKFWPTRPEKFKCVSIYTKLLVYKLQTETISLILQRDLKAYSSEVRRVSKELMGSISSIMGLDKDILLQVHKE
ncbi:S-norcoclaurine synthase 1-like [Actinidia eriantha]|uniref:S-norcoclaurine synthase 1-like n=1 Tax=Actinidia eriantha TaxID=165200 RepID=UPI00258AC804|nr:S-norcoclaurine synthase 1-like [Actinidia eriantha]